MDSVPVSPPMSHGLLHLRLRAEGQSQWLGTKALPVSLAGGDTKAPLRGAWLVLGGPSCGQGCRDSANGRARASGAKAQIR